MKKKVLSIVAILVMFVMLVSLTACGKDKKKEEEVASSPKDAVEQFLDYVEAGRFSKASKLVDWTLTYKTYEEGYSYYDSVDYEEIEDMSSKEIKEYEDDNESDIEYAETSFESYKSTIDDLASFKIDADLEKAEKVDGTKNIYLVEADIEMTYKEDKKDDEETEDDTIEFYVMKDGEEYKIIDGVYDVKYMISDISYGY